MHSFAYGKLRVLEERPINRIVLPDVTRCLVSHVLFHRQYLVSVGELAFKVMLLCSECGTSKKICALLTPGASIVWRRPSRIQFTCFLNK